jgi:hypothetical protein
MNLAQTRKKIDEAQFFLGKMIERERLAFGDHAEFDLSLSEIQSG